jgi:hypothetical protein
MFWDKQTESHRSTSEVRKFTENMFCVNEFQKRESSLLIDLINIQIN